MKISDDLNELTKSEINKIINQNYVELGREIKKYSKNLILESIGIQVDHWDHITGIRNELKDLIIEQESVQKLKDILIQDVIKSINTKLKNEIEDNKIKPYNSRILNSIIQKVMLQIHKEIEAEIENEIFSILSETYKKHVKEQIYSNPLIKELSLRKL